jgi:hypothetical protein
MEISMYTHIPDWISVTILGSNGLIALVIWTGFYRASQSPGSQGTTASVSAGIFPGGVVGTGDRSGVKRFLRAICRRARAGYRFCISSAFHRLYSGVRFKLLAYGNRCDTAAMGDQRSNLSNCGYIVFGAFRAGEIAGCVCSSGRYRRFFGWNYRATGCISLPCKAPLVARSCAALEHDRDNRSRTGGHARVLVLPRPIPPSGA